VLPSDDWRFLDAIILQPSPPSGIPAQAGVRTPSFYYPCPTRWKTCVEAYDWLSLRQAYI
jgi:hypothetical protein